MEGCGWVNEWSVCVAELRRGKRQRGWSCEVELASLCISLGRSFTLVSGPFNVYE